MGTSAQHPLFAALMGQAIKQKRPFDSLNRRELIHRHLNTTNRIPWKHPERKQNHDEGVLGIWTGSFISAASVRRNANFDEFWKLIPRSTQIETNRFSGYHRQRIIDRCMRIVASSNDRFLKPFEPDILGENFFLLFFRELGDREPSHNGEISKAFIQMLCISENGKHQEEIASNLIDFCRRTARNLSNDKHCETDQDWKTLLNFLQPSKFPQGSTIRFAVSIAIIEVIEICKHSCVNQNWARILISRTDINDLVLATDGSLLVKAATASLKYFEWISDELRQHEEIQRLILKSLENFESRNTSGWTSIMFSCFTGCCAFLQLIDETGQLDQVYVNATDTNGTTALIWASQNGHYSIVKLLIDRGAEINKPTGKRGWTALMAACKHKHAKIVELLIERGANVSQTTTDFEYSALHIASDEGSLPIIKILVENGANPRQQSIGLNQSPIQYAMNAGHDDVVTYLRESDNVTNPNAKANAFGDFINACQYGSLNTVKQFIDAGVDVNQIGGLQNCHAPLIAASSRRDDQIDIVELLIESGANPNIQNGFNQTPLLIAVQRNKINIISFLLKSGASIQPSNLLCIASRRGKCNIVKTLIAADADPNATSDTEKNQTPLMIASAKGHLEVINILTHHLTTEINKFDDIGETALDKAIANEQQIAVSLLLNGGAKRGHDIDI